MTAADIGELDPREPHNPTTGASDPAARLADMDTMGIDQAVLYPTMFLEYFPLIRSPDVAYALARAYNDWIFEFVRAEPHRLVPVAVLPLQDVTFAIHEARRVAATGCGCVLIRPVVVNGRYPHDPHFRPLWQELETLGLTACAHAAAGPAAAEMEANAPFVERVTANVALGHPVAETVAHTMDNAVFLVGIMSEGLMERYPRLRTTFAHAGAAWLPITLEKVETYLWLSYQREPVSLEPERIFFSRDNLVTFDSGEGCVRRMPDLYASVGAWGSRYPNHDTSTPAVAVADLEASGVAPDVVSQLMGGNASRVLGLETTTPAAAR
jgi:predicted TIM-barrel fold metal-dependent hydrolase